jgi:hypothetical protein
VLLRRGRLALGIRVEYLRRSTSDRLGTTAQALDVAGGRRGLRVPDELGDEPTVLLQPDDGRRDSGGVAAGRLDDVRDPWGLTAEDCGERESLERGDGPLSRVDECPSSIEGSPRGPARGLDHLEAYGTTVSHVACAEPVRCC